MPAGHTTAQLSLLLEDPDLGAAIPPEERRHAERLLAVPGFTAAAGALELPEGLDELSLGLLILSGLVTSNIVLGDRVASQLSGPGDVLELRADDEALLPVLVEHHVSEPARIAVLDRHFIAAVRRWPGLLLTLHERLRAQERRLAVHAAIGKLRRVEDRVLALLWHLAERWGRMTTDGVVVPLALTHETIGRLAGAERPTISLALAELTEQGAIARRTDGAFVLAQESLVTLAPARLAQPQLRPLAARTMPPPDAAGVARTGEPEAPPIDRVQLFERIAALRAEHAERAQTVQNLLERARASSRRSAEARRMLAEQRERRLQPRA